MNLIFVKHLRSQKLKFLETKVILDTAKDYIENSVDEAQRLMFIDIIDDILENGMVSTFDHAIFQYGNCIKDLKKLVTASGRYRDAQNFANIELAKFKMQLILLYVKTEFKEDYELHHAVLKYL